jgi:N-methylhydantoinase A/oxoprolinase/acetone carboxylase beta subunit
MVKTSYDLSIDQMAKIMRETEDKIIRKLTEEKMDKKDWRFDVMCAIRLSFREGWSLERLKKKISEIEKSHEEKEAERTRESTQSIEEDREGKHAFSN